MIRQEAHLVADVPDAPRRDPGPLHPRSCASPAPSTSARGVSARFAIAGAETIAAAALHRATAPGRGAGGGPGRSTSRPPSTCSAARSSSSPARRAARTRSSPTCCAPPPPRPSGSHFRGLDLGLLVEAIENGAMVTTGEQVTARDFLTGLPVLGESELYDEICDRLGRHERRPARRRDRARARGPLPGPQGRQGHRRRRDGLRLGRWRADEGPDPLQAVRRRRPARPAGRPGRGAGRHRRGRDGRLLARAGDAGVPAPRRPDQTGLDDLARRVAERRRELLQRHNLDGTLPGGPRAARPRGARGAQAAGPRRDDGRRRPGVPGDAAGRTCRRTRPPR